MNKARQSTGNARSPQSRKAGPRRTPADSTGAAAIARTHGKRGPRVDVEQTKRRRREIVQGAARLFDRVGYHRVNMSMIAEAAGVKKPTLYHYIKSKDDILFMLHELFVGKLLSKTATRLERDEGELDVLRGTIFDTLQLLHDYPGYMRAFYEHTRELSREQRAVVAARRDEYIELILHVIERAMAKGLINKADPRLTANCLFAVGNWPYQWYRPNRDPAPEEIAEQSWQILLKGLAYR